MNQNALSKIILDSAFRVHPGLGPRLLEHVYEVVLAHELGKQKLKVAQLTTPQQTQIPPFACLCAMPQSLNPRPPSNPQIPPFALL